jgi:hypothetical protein
MQFIVEASRAVTISTGDLLLISSRDPTNLLVCCTSLMECGRHASVIVNGTSFVNAPCGFYTRKKYPLAVANVKIPIHIMSHNTRGVWHRIWWGHERSILEFMGTNVY